MKNKGIKKLFSLVIVFAMMFSMMMPVGVAYALPAVISTVSTIANAQATPSIVVTLAGDTFTAAGTSELVTNWTITLGTSGLTVNSITRNSDTQATIAFTGTAAPGTVAVQANAAALTGAAISNSIDVEVTVISTLSTIANAQVAPSIVITLVNETFTAAGISELLTNWTITVGTSGLTVDSITRDSATQATITFTGTAKAGIVAVQANAATLIGAAVSNSIHVAIPAVTISTVSIVANAAVAPNIVITLANATFAAAGTSELPVNWTITTGTTGLIVNTITRDSGTQATIAFTGIAAAGTIGIQAKASALTGLDASNSISVVVPATTNAAAILIGGSLVPLTNLNASDISASITIIDIKLTGGNKWNTNIKTDTGAIFTNLYPTLKTCFSNTANQSQWNTLFDSATFAWSDPTTITMTIPNQSYNIQSSQTVTFTPQTSLLQDLAGTPVTPPSFNITADYATISGTLTTGANQSKIISGGEKLIITLTNCKWADDATIAANKVSLFGVGGLESSAGDANEWNKVITALNNVLNPIAVNVDRSIMTITLPAVPNYNPYVSQTVTLSSLNKLLLTDTNSTPGAYQVPLPNIINKSFNISPDTANTTISWAATPALTEAKLTDGSSDTLSMTLGNNTWAADLNSIPAPNKVRQQALLDGFTTSTDVAAWNKVKAAILASGTFGLSPDNRTLSITIPITITGGYSILGDQIVNVNIPSTALNNNFAVSPNALSFTISANSAVAVSGTLTVAGVNEMDIVNGGKTIVATLTNATWDPSVTTLLTMRENLIDALLNPIASWPNVELINSIATIKAGATYTLNDDLSAVTITLPPVPGFNISSDLSISSLIPTGTIPAVTQVSSPSFTITPITNQSASISGTVTTATESDIVTGGKTLVLTLKNDVWAQDVVSNNNKLSALGTGIGAIWTLTSSNVVRTSDTVLTITLPPAPAYDANALNQTINVIIPWKESVTNKPLLSTSVQSLNAGSFIVKAVAATLSGTAVTAPLDSASVITGGKTLVITLTNATWASDVASASRLLDLQNCFSASPTTVNWTDIENKITASNITLSGKNVLTIKLPPMPTYSWNGNSEQVTFSIDGTILPNLITEKLSSTKTLTASSKVSIGQTLQSPIKAVLSGTALNMAVSDVVTAGNKTIVITLTNGSWDPLLTTNSAKISTLVGGFTADSDSTSWALVQTALKKASLITNNPFKLSTALNANDTLTITLPAVPSYDPLKNQIVSLTIPKTVLVPATANVSATGSITINLPSPTGSPSTLQSMLGDGSFATLINGGWSLQKIYLAVPKKYLTSVVVKQYPIDNTTVNSLDIYTDSDVASVNVLVNGTNYPSGTATPVGTGKKFNVGFATVNTTAVSTLPYDAIISVLNSSNSKLQTDVAIKISGSKTYSLAPTTDLSGRYSLYKLVNNKSLLDSILKPSAYVPDDIMVETTT